MRSVKSPTGTSSFLLVAVNATLEDSSFKMGSEVAANTHELIIASKLKGDLPTNATLNRDNVWRLFFMLRSSSTFNSLWRFGDRFYSRYIHVHVGVSPT